MSPSPPLPYCRSPPPRRSFSSASTLEWLQAWRLDRRALETARRQLELSAVPATAPAVQPLQLVLKLQP